MSGDGGLDEVLGFFGDFEAETDKVIAEAAVYLDLLYGRADSALNGAIHQGSELLAKLKGKADNKLRDAENKASGLLASYDVGVPDSPPEPAGFSVPDSPLTGSGGCNLLNPTPPADCVVNVIPRSDTTADIEIAWTNPSGMSYVSVEIPELNLSVGGPTDPGRHAHVFPGVELCCQLTAQVVTGCVPRAEGQDPGWEERCTLIVPPLTTCPDDQEAECSQPEPPQPPEEPQECQTCCCCPCQCGNDSPEEDPPPGLKTWCVYWTADKTQCYVNPCDEGPTDENDIFVADFRTRGSALDYASVLCGDGGEGGNEPGQGPLMFEAGKGQCAADFYDNLRESLKGNSNLFRNIASINDFARDQVMGIVGLVDDALGGFAFPFRPVWEAFKAGLAFLFGGPETAANFVKALGCEPDPLLAIKLTQSFFEMVSRITGVDLSFAIQPLRYMLNGLCPYLHPTAAEAVQAYLGNTIDEDRLATLLSINGVCPEPAAPVIEAGRTKLPPGVLVDAYYRGLIEDDELRAELRASGHLQPKQAEIYKQLGRFIPPPTDLVRFMVRDVEDSDIVERFGLDDDFGDKFRGPLARWANQQGVDDETMLRYWRAHWTIPSPTQLYEMYHRLRFSDDPNLVVDEDVVTTALKQQDIPEAWIKRFLAVSFSPLTRVDARRAFDLGEIDEEELRKSYLDQGYNDENARILVKFSGRLKEEGIESQRSVKLYMQGLMSEADVREELLERGFDSGFVMTALGRLELKRIRSAHTERPYKQFLDGTIDEQEFRGQLIDRNYTDIAIGKITEAAMLELDKRFRKRCEDSLRTRFFWGELDEFDAKEELQRIGMPPIYAQKTADNWACELVSAEKQGTMRVFREGLEFGTLTPEEVEQRLRRLRYSDDMARKITAAMVERLRLREEKAAKAEQEKIERDLKRKERERKRTSDEIKRNQEKGQRLLEAQRKAREKRATTIARANSDYAGKFGYDPNGTIETVQSLQGIIASTTSLNLDHQVRLIVEAVKRSIKTDNDDLISIGVALAEATDDWIDDVEFG